MPGAGAPCPGTSRSALGEKPGAGGVVGRWGGGLGCGGLGGGPKGKGDFEGWRYRFFLFFFEREVVGAVFFHSEALCNSAFLSSSVEFNLHGFWTLLA